MSNRRRTNIHKVFKSLEDAIEDKEKEMRKRMVHAEYPVFLSNLMSTSLQTMGSSVETIEDLVTGSQTVGRMVAAKAKKEVKRDPWAFLGKVALGSLGLGITLGLLNRKPRLRAKHE